ncbi:MAG: glycosyltransferase [Bacteroidales bacterium]|nr:glycosyltransferase [Bacteroidales bacterium]
MIFFAIPFYKNVGFLEDTLKSLLNQTSEDWNAVVLDDSIDNGEAAQAKKLIENLNDSRIKYQKNIQNIGMGNNWNQGLELGRKHSKAIATTILHADDRLLPEYVASMLGALDHSPNTTAFFCETVVIDENGKRLFSFADYYKTFLLPKKKNGVITLNGIEGIAPLIPGNFIFCPTLCYRNSRLERLFDANLKMVIDFEYTLDLLIHGHQLKGLYSKPLFEYRRHSSSTTNLMNQNLERFKEEKFLYFQIAKKLDAKGCYKLAKKARQMKIVKRNLLFQITSSFLRCRFSLANRYLQYYLSL